MAVADNNHKLTTEQRAIAEASDDRRIIVTAGPGTGKTHTLVARLSALIEMHGLSPGYEILVLSFSRAAVNEIQRRSTASKDGAAYVRPLTFDSFATQLLAESDPAGDWAKAGYEGRIVKATERIRLDENAKSYIRAFKHLVIDEAQDLVGARAELVTTLLTEFEGGFTIFGDPAQGIYGFQLAQLDSSVDSADAVMEWVRRSYVRELEDLTLTTNYRATSSEASRFLWVGEELNKRPQPPYSTVIAEIERQLLQVRQLGKFRNGAMALLKNVADPTAVLCRNNGQALMCSRELWDQNVSHVYRLGASSRIVPDWLGKLFFDYEHTSVGRTNFCRMVEENYTVEASPDTLWDLIRQTGSIVGSKLDLTKLARKIRSGNMPERILEVPDANLVVSTIHRAKGLEFDGVVLAKGDLEVLIENKLALAEEVRVLYVALTRPKRDIYRLELPAFKGLFRHPEAGRWVRRYGWKAIDFEVAPDDIESLEPAGSDEEADFTVFERQLYVTRSVHPGDAVSLSLVEEAERIAFYYVLHKGIPVGRTTEEFARRLFAFLRVNPGWKVKWPTCIEKLRVDGVDTVAGSSFSKSYGRLGPNGLWLRVRVSGLGSLRF